MKTRPLNDETIIELRSHNLRRSWWAGTVQVGGLRTNLGFLQRVLSHPSFAAADLDTTFISKHHEDLLIPRPLTPELYALAAALMHQSLVAQARPVACPTA